MRHLVLATTGGAAFGGMETFTRGLVSWLLDAGWRLTIALSGPADTRQNDCTVATFADAASAATAHSGRHAPLETGLAGRDSRGGGCENPNLHRDSHQLARGNLEIRPVNWVDVSDLSGDRRYTRAAVIDRWRWFQRTRPDAALFIQSSNTPLRAAILGAWLAGIPVVTTQRTLPARLPEITSRRHFLGLIPGIGLHRRRLIFSAQFTAQLAARVVYNSDAVRRRYEAEYGYPAAHGAVIPNAVKLPAAATPTTTSQADNGPRRPAFRVGYVGRFGREKRIDILLHAIAQLPPGIGAELHGDGPERDALTKLATELGLGDRVRFCGPTAHPQDLYARFDAVALCSPREASSNMVLEAMAAGRPVVVTRVGGLPELVEDGRAGVCVEPLQPAELAQALSRLALDPHERIRLGNAARECARIHHDPRRIAARWCDLLSGVARSARGTHTRRAIATPPRMEMCT